MLTHGEDGKNRLPRFMHSWLGLCLLLLPIGVSAQTWTWSFETVAPSGKQVSLAIDAQGNAHLSYFVSTASGPSAIPVARGLTNKLSRQPLPGLNLRR